MKTPKKTLIVVCLLAITAGWTDNLIAGEKDLLRIDNETANDRSHKHLKVRSNVFGQVSLREEERESHGPGVFANIGIFAPASNYMNPYPFYVGPSYNTGYVAEVGNYFRFFNTERFGIGLRATWIQLGYTSHPDTSWSEGNAWGSPLRLGPQASYAINEVMGIDLFYQLGAQYNMDWWDGENQSFLGLNHEFGLAYRFMFITAGATMKTGATKNIDNSDPTWALEKVLKFSTAGFRVFVGIQM